MGHAFVRRVLARLKSAEGHETNRHFQDDYRIAWLTVLNAAGGHQQPHVAATYAVLRLHPNKVWPAIVERRKAKLGRLYDQIYDQHGQLRPPDYDKLFSENPPKKPPQSVRFERRQGERRQGERRQHQDPWRWLA
jgi:hypothetical protein